MIGKIGNKGKGKVRKSLAIFTIDLYSYREAGKRTNERALGILIVRVWDSVAYFYYFAIRNMNKNQPSRRGAAGLKEGSTTEYIGGSRVAARLERAMKTN